jgi:tungstate transport system permease protein
MWQTFHDAGVMLTRLDPEVVQIVALSLKVSLSALLLGTLVGMPLGAIIAVSRFPGRAAVTVFLNGMMGMPPVVLGVIVYLLLSRSGPLGELGLLFTPGAMITAQTLLILPLIAALTRQIIEDAWRECALEFSAYRLTRRQSVLTLLFDCRFSLVVAVLAGLGRAVSEVGAVMIVGGNIDGFTRVMTTAIALETSKGDLPLSIALGIVLITLQMARNALAYALRQWAMRRYG